MFVRSIIPFYLSRLSVNFGEPPVQWRAIFLNQLFPLRIDPALFPKRSTSWMKRLHLARVFGFNSVGRHRAQRQRLNWPTSEYLVVGTSGLAEN
jgi:hypothetical protein